MQSKLNYCNFFIWMNFFRLAWQCLSNSLYCPGAPKAFPGLLNRSWWPTLQKSISLYCTGYGYILIHHIVTFLKDSELEIQASFSFVLWNWMKSIANIFNIYEYIWLVHKVNEKSWACGSCALELLAIVKTGPPPDWHNMWTGYPLEKRCLQKYLFPFTFHCWYW